MEEMANRPRWLLELENRKRKPRLAHEAGAGSPCVKCNSACPGLDLHFWRKICKNCKCSRDDHDVDDDEFPQFDLLFGPSGKFRKKPTCLLVDNKKQNNSETTFEWVPPNTTKELAMDYMKALPTEKLPIKGSTGAALRRQLLQKQLPLHDIDHKVCDELSEQEQKQFEKYLENIRKYVGQGKVMKMLGARPFDRSFMTPINATDMQRCSPQHKPHILSTGVQLRTPSSFAIKSPYAKQLYDNQNKQDTTAVQLIPNSHDENRMFNAERYNCSLVNLSANSDIAKSQLNEGIFHNNSQHINNNALMNERGINSKIINSSVPIHLADQEIVPTREMQSSENYIPYGGCATNTFPPKISSEHLEERKETFNNIKPHFAYSETANNEVASIAESMLADAFLPPSAIRANDIIGSTLDEERLMFIREKLSDKYNVVENPVIHTVSKLSRPLDASDILYPRNSGAKENNNFASINKNAERATIVAAMKNPTGMLSEKDVTNIANDAALKAERRTYKPSSHVAQSTPLIAVAPACINEQKQCDRLPNYKSADNDSILNMELSKGMTADAPITSFSLNKYKSENPTVPISNASLQAELNNSILQSTTIHSEPLQIQIFPHDIVGSSNESAQPMQHMEYLRDAMEDLKMDSTKAQKCQKCHEEIRVGDVIVIAEKANNASWHPGCFVCSVCSELLVDLVYFYYKNKLYCGRDLAAFLGIPRCFACDELIFVREYTVAEGHNYHVKHFCCWDCDIPLAGQQYIAENDRPLCLPCYQKTYAKTCSACNIVIAADQQGVAIKNLNFHATEACFCCYSCRKNLLNGKIAIKEDKLFCSRECIAKFLNR